MELQQQVAEILVSVPIRGLFNLTGYQFDYECELLEYSFPSPSGDYLI